MDQSGNNSNGGASPTNPTHLTDSTNLMAQLTQAMTILTDVSMISLANSLFKVKVIQKPSPFKGE
jgi:hypothetical protein